ncbi:hypothetical protein [Bradyrhizobium sp. 174]|uniref:hypothetical protein n=1 Tax=Bradyrhizobium sp. 174 TaxID=2782645 RepID=UPI001FFAF657|nr:hypothetical protein [Bradyrhizobium sp. 174]MCK1577825.1 hypothetical protein [Bradyrhizobium sp. 174]
MPKEKKPTADELAAAVADLAPPTSQKAWRATSHAMRAARRALGPGREFTRTISLCCGDARRRLDLWGTRSVAPYNGPSPLSYVGMIGHQRRRYAEGCRAGRIEAARQFAAAARADGPIPLPS